MSALVCGKRSSSIFEEHAHTPPPSVSKRARCCFAGAASPTTAVLRPSPAPSTPCFDGNDSGSSVDIHQVAAHIAHLRSLFPEMDPQVRCIMNDCKDATAPIQPAEERPPRDNSEWVELFVRGMMNASDINDAMSRASQMLGVLEKSITASAGAEAMKSLHKVS
ncbi:hypothetical protein GW17_00055533 [Ensete ventricosum]|nr:hypothetical protein GW17_00055533 [Ensete ventricosum]RZS27475.1 hypothetical protein BHM03_00060970 [Ensete ventricosum]